MIQMFNIEDGLIQTIEAIHKGSRVYVLINNLVEDFFKTTRGVRQDCSLSPALQTFFVENLKNNSLSPFTSLEGLYTT